MSFIAQVREKRQKLAAVLTDDDSLAAHVSSARQLGLSVDTFTREKGLATWHYEVRGPGHRMHMNDLAAAIGVAQLARRADRVITTLLRWYELSRQRRALLRLDDHMLKDIGLSRVDALREADRRFWDEGSEPWRR